MTPASLARIRLDIAYDGTNFAGWAVQPNRRTVQGVIEEALGRILRSKTVVRLTVAGRTDAGVHALGQVAHADVTTNMTPAELQRRLGRYLGADSDVAIHAVTLALPGFDARFSAEARRYEYRIMDGAERVNPMERHRAVILHDRLDLAVMNDVAGRVLGLRDFGAFCKPRFMSTTIRELQEFSWRRDDDHTLVASLQADAFCHSMVRALVGACVAVAQGRLSMAGLERLRDGAKRTSKFKVLAPHGLCLTEVIYPPDALLAERAALTRDRRDLPSE